MDQHPVPEHQLRMAGHVFAPPPFLQDFGVPIKPDHDAMFFEDFHAFGQLGHQQMSAMHAAHQQKMPKEEALSPPMHGQRMVSFLKILGSLPAKIQYKFLFFTR
jgi:hypothetical protein